MRRCSSGRLASQAQSERYVDVLRAAQHHDGSVVVDPGRRHRPVKLSLRPTLLALEIGGERRNLSAILALVMLSSPRPTWRIRFVVLTAAQLGRISHPTSPKPRRTKLLAWIAAAVVVAVLAGVALWWAIGRSDGDVQWSGFPRTYACAPRPDNGPQLADTPHTGAATWNDRTVGHF